MKKRVFGDEEKWLVELIVGIVLCVMGFLFMAVLPNAAIVIILVGIVYIVIGSRRKRKQNKTENYQGRPRGSGAFVQRNNSVPARQRNLPPQQSYTAPRSKWNFTLGDIYNGNL